MLLSAILDNSVFILVHCSLCSLLFAIISSGLYSILYLISLWLLVSIRYTLFFLFSLLFQCLYAILFVSSILTIVFNVYTLSLTTSGIWLSKSFLISILFFLTTAWSFTYLAPFLTIYFLSLSIITFTSSNPDRASSFPRSTGAISDCPGISILVR